MQRNHTAHFIASKSTWLTSLLREHFKQTEDQARQLIELGAIYSNKIRVLEDIPIEKGRYLRIHLKPKRFPVEGIEWEKHLVEEREDFIVIRKPPGIPVHATLDNVRENSLAEMRRVLGYELYATQRLDIPVEGLLVFARTKKFQAHFNRLLLERKVTKRYWAVSHRLLEKGRYVSFMQPSERSPRVMSKEPKPGWQDCILSVEATETLKDGNTLHSILLETGRTHQIRAQMSLLGAPLLGDFLYGGGKSSRFQLYCVEVGWEKCGPFRWQPIL